MNGKSIRLWFGLVLFLAGGALLAFAGNSAGLVGVGTTMGIVGVALMVWAWFTRGAEEDGGGS
ncbi:MAG: hypothetical protein GY715_20135 [Planctomycetes bacterium]|nr:hypothetical protein [Planctomycetota bacterium]